jgi:hypothetical protein
MLIGRKCAADAKARHGKHLAGFFMPGTWA